MTIDEDGWDSSWIPNNKLTVVHSINKLKKIL